MTKWVIYVVVGIRLLTGKHLPYFVCELAKGKNYISLHTRDLKHPILGTSSETNPKHPILDLNFDW